MAAEASSGSSEDATRKPPPPPLTSRPPAVTIAASPPTPGQLGSRPAPPGALKRMNSSPVIDPNNPNAGVRGARMPPGTPGLRRTATSANLHGAGSKGASPPGGSSSGGKPAPPGGGSLRRQMTLNVLKKTKTVAVLENKKEDKWRFDQAEAPTAATLLKQKTMKIKSYEHTITHKNGNAFNVAAEVTKRFGADEDAELNAYQTRIAGKDNEGAPNAATIRKSAVANQSEASWMTPRLTRPTPTKKWTKLMLLAADQTADLGLFRWALVRAKEQGKIDEKNEDGQTALMLAVRMGFEHDDSRSAQFEKIDMLVSRGANVFLSDNDAETAMSIAAGKKWHDVVLLMLTSASTRRAGWVGWSGLVSLEMIKEAMVDCPARARRGVNAACVDAYCAMQHDELIEVMIRSFTTSRELVTWRKALHNTICWASEGFKRYMAVRAIDALAADMAYNFSMCGQIVAAGVLQQLSLSSDTENKALYSKAGELMRAGLGRDAFETAVHGEAKVFLSQPVVQRFVDREWRGFALDILFNDESLDDADKDAAVVKLARSFHKCGLSLVPLIFILMFFNLLLLPFVTLFPPLEPKLAAFLGRNDSLLLIRSPMVKYIFATIADIIFASIVTFGVFDGPTASRIPRIFLLVWSASFCWSEIMELVQSEKTLSESLYKAFMHWVPLVKSKGKYYSVTLNSIDLPAGVLTFAGLLLSYKEWEEQQSALAAGVGIVPDEYAVTYDPINGNPIYPRVKMWRYVLGLGLLLSWLRQLRILLNVPTVGPLVLMIMKMITAMKKWIYIVILFIFAFSSMFYTFLPGCAPFYEWPVRLISATFTGDEFEHCLQSSIDLELSWLFSYLMITVNYVLLLNLLIAILSRTFDNISDASIMNYQLLRAQLTVNWQDVPPAPSPLRVLRVPYEVYEMCASVCFPEKEEEKRKPPRARLPADDFFAMAKRMDIAVKDYYLHRQDDTASEDRWRVQLNKSISSKLNLQERKFGFMLDEVEREVRQMDEKLDTLLSVNGVEWPPNGDQVDEDVKKAAAAIVVQARARGQKERGKRKLGLLDAVSKVGAGESVKSPLVPATAPDGAGGVPPASLPPSSPERGGGSGSPTSKLAGFGLIRFISKVKGKSGGGKYRSSSPTKGAGDSPPSSRQNSRPSSPTPGGGVGGGGSARVRPAPPSPTPPDE